MMRIPLTFACITLALPVLWLMPAAAAPADTMPEEVSKELVKAFGAGKNKKTSVTEKTRAGFRTRTVTFSIGIKTYRVVFSGDGNVSIALMQEGDLAAQPIWTAPSRQVRVEEIVNVIYAREMGKTYDPYAVPKTEAETAADLERERVKNRKDQERKYDGSALRWNRLMNRVLAGDTAGASGGSKSQPEQGFSQAAAAAKAMDPCGYGGGGLSPQRAAMTDIAQAMSAASFEALRRGRGDADQLADRSREYNKKKTSSVLEELNEHRETPEDAFRLIQDSGVDTAELFRSALAESDRDAKDPHALAAARNFKAVIRGAGEKKAAEIVRRVLKRVVVDVTAFTELRRISAGEPVIYDRVSDQYFVDPTLNSPSEARYLLSLATWYDFQLRAPEFTAWLNEYKDRAGKISTLEQTAVDQRDERELAAQKTAITALAGKLDAFALNLRQTHAYPR